MEDMAHDAQYSSEKAGVDILQSSPRSSAIQEMSDELARFSDMIERLEARLTPFLRPKFEEGGSNVSQAPAPASGIQLQVWQLQGCNARLTELWERVDN